VEEDETGRSFDAASSPALTHAIHSSFAMEERTQEGSREGDQEAERGEADEKRERRERGTRDGGATGHHFCTPHIFYD